MEQKHVEKLEEISAQCDWIADNMVVEADLDDIPRWTYKKERNLLLAIREQARTLHLSTCDCPLCLALDAYDEAMG